MRRTSVLYVWIVKQRRRQKILQNSRRSMFVLGSWQEFNGPGHFAKYKLESDVRICLKRIAWYRPDKSCSIYERITFEPASTLTDIKSSNIHDVLNSNEPERDSIKKTPSLFFAVRGINRIDSSPIQILREERASKIIFSIKHII